MTPLHKDECTGGDCVTAWFKLDAWITDFGESGTVTVPFSAFSDEFGAELDTRSVGSLGIDVGRGAVDYCIRDLQFLDANGAVVDDE